MKDARKSVQPPAQSKEFLISDQTDYLLSHDHKKRTAQHYKILVKNAIKLPNVKDKRSIQTENLIKRSLAREDLRRSKEIEKELIHQNSIQQLQKYKDMSPKKLAPSERDFPKRFIYFVVDGQSVFTPGHFYFSHIEVNHKLNSLIS